MQRLKHNKKTILTSMLMLVLACIYLLLSACMQMRTSDKATKKRFDEASVQHAIIRFEPQTIKIEGMEIETRTIKTFQSKKEQAILFVHGAPGSADAFYDYLENTQLLEKANLYSVDRLGYGYSNYGQSVNSIKQQAKVISEFIDSQIEEKNVMIVGHSYGGPISAYVASINERISHLVMLAPANDPENEKIFWFSHFAKWKLTKWVLPKSLQVSGDEKFSHSFELAQIQSIWENINVPTIYFHGKKDSIVPIVNLEFTKTLMQNEIFEEVIFEDENHFIPWTQKDVIIEKLIEVLEK